MMKRLFVSMFVALSVVLLFTGCQKEDPSSPSEFTVIFNTNGGSTVAALTVVMGEKASKPLPPIKADMAFDNWYQEVTLTNVYDFGTAVTSNITLYAKWIAITREALESLVVDADAINVGGYTSKTISEMKEKLEAARQVLQSESSTSQQITTAYSELSASIHALIALPYKEVVGIFVNGVIDGVAYISPGEPFSLYAYSEGAEGGYATDDRVIFTYDVSKLATWAEGDVQVDGNGLWFSAKSTLTPGATVSVTIKSVDKPAVTKTVTLKVAAPAELKGMYLNTVNTLPTPDKIAYEHYSTLKKAFDLRRCLTNEDLQDPAVLAANEKLRECEDAYYNLPVRVKYSFKGNICMFTELNGVSQEMPIGEFNFAANGAFPTGTFTQNGWSVGDELFYQYRLIMKSDGTGFQEMREAEDATGTDATAWKEEGTFSYTNQGTQAAGGMLLFSFNQPELDSGKKSVRSAGLVRTPLAGLRTIK